MAEWSTIKNYSPKDVNGGNRWTSTPGYEDLARIAETVFNLNARETYSTLYAHCANNETALSHRDCVISGWRYVSSTDKYKPTSITSNYIVFTMAYSRSNLVQLAFDLDKKAVWLARAYPNSSATTVWDEWLDLSGGHITLNSQKVNMDMNYDSSSGTLSIATTNI